MIRMKQVLFVGLVKQGSVTMTYSMRATFIIKSVERLDCAMCIDKKNFASIKFCEILIHAGLARKDSNLCIPA